MEKTPMLVVRKDSWHYNYWVFIRNKWGLSKTPETTSLCPYCQTIFWFSFLALLLSPSIITGWVCLKLFRSLYKVLANMGYNKFIDFIDASPLGDVLGESHDKMSANPFSTTILTFFLAAIAFVLICGILILFFLRGKGTAQLSGPLLDGPHVCLLYRGLFSLYSFFSPYLLRTVLVLDWR